MSIFFSQKFKNRCRDCFVNTELPFDTGIHIVLFILGTAAFFSLLQSVGFSLIREAAIVIGFTSPFLVVRRCRLFVVITSGVCIWLSMVLANAYFDVAYDGLAYHQAGILSIERNFSIFSETLTGPYSWLTTYYPKQSWLFGGAILALFGNMALCKSINFLLVIAVFFIGLSCFRNFDSRLRILVSLIIALNPIAVAQLFSNYVDGALGAYLTIAALGSYCSLRGKQSPWENSLLIYTGLLGASSLKFTGAAFSLILLLILLCFYGTSIFSIFSLKRIVDKIRSRRSGVSVLNFVAVVYFAVLGFFLLFDPYVTNLMRGNHIFHPAMGEERYDWLISEQTPPEFEALDPWSKLLLSVFSKSYNLAFWVDEPYPEPKIPFVVYTSEIAAFAMVDVRAAGWGPLFGGVLLVALVLYLSKLEACTAYHRIVLLVGVLSMINPHSWWARFNPQLYLLPVFLLLGVHALSRAHRVVVFGLLCVLLLNSALIFLSMLQALHLTNAKVSQAIVELRDSSADDTVYWNLERFHLEPIFDRLGVLWAPMPENVNEADLNCIDVRLVRDMERVCVIRSREQHELRDSGAA